MKLNIKAKLMLKWYRIDKRIQVQVGVILDTIRNSSEDSNPKNHLMTQLKKLWDICVDVDKGNKRVKHALGEIEALVKNSDDLDKDKLYLYLYRVTKAICTRE